MFLVTGGAGYIGSHMVLRLIEEGAEVVIFDNLKTGHIETVQNLQVLSDKVKFVKGDLENREEIFSVFKNYDIEGVFHFAALALVGESVTEPSKYWHNNVIGTINLLESMILKGVGKIVFSSTCATYGEPAYTPIDEKHPQNPINPYGRTKLVVENIMDDYKRAYGLQSVRLRYFNVAGADKDKRTGEWHDVETHLIPNIIKSALNENKVFEIYGDDYNTKDGTCVRDYIDMEDLIEAHMLAFKYLQKGGMTDSFNLGTNEGSSVKEVFETAQEVIGKKINYVIKPRREGDPAVLIGSHKKAEEVLGWKPKRTLRDSIRNAYDWEIKRTVLYN